MPQYNELGNFPVPTQTHSIQPIPLPNPSMLVGNMGGMANQIIGSIPGGKANPKTDIGRQLGGAIQNELEYALPRLGQAYANAWGNTPVGQLFRAGAQTNPETDAGKKAGDFLAEQINRFTGGTLPYFGN